MDLRLPDMDGTDAARRLGDDARTAAIPVVALSALPLEGGGDWLQAAGFAGWLEKPISVGEFPDQVRRYCTSTAMTVAARRGVPAPRRTCRRAR